MRLKGQSLFRSLLIIPWMSPVIAICAVWKWMYNNDFGILTYAINTAFGTHLTFLSDYNIALYCLGIIYVWKRAPFIMLMYLSGMQSISEDVYEAAELDGCRGFKRLTQITLPLLFPIIRSWASCRWSTPKPPATTTFPWPPWIPAPARPVR